MHRATKGKKTFSKRVRMKLIEQDMTVTALATEMNRPRSTVSRAIHTTKFPKIKELIESTLFTSE